MNPTFAITLIEAGRLVLRLNQKPPVDVGIASETEFRQGRVGDAICQVAEDKKIYFIIVGYRGRGIVGRVLLRSVSQEVVRAALRPVLIARKSAGRHQATAETRSVYNALGTWDISGRNA